MGELDHPLSAPRRLAPEDDVSAFASTEPTLNRWLLRHARRSEGRTARSYVVCAGPRVVGYYALANAAIVRETAIGRLQRNAPDPIPVMLLARLATDRDWLGRGIARGMLKDALLRTLAAAEIAGIAALVTHALSDDARRFYEHHGFTPSPIHPRTLMITMREVFAQTS